MYLLGWNDCKFSYLNFPPLLTQKGHCGWVPASLALASCSGNWIRLCRYPSCVNSCNYHLCKHRIVLVLFDYVTDPFLVCNRQLQTYSRPDHVGWYNHQELLWRKSSSQVCASLTLTHTVRHDLLLQRLGS